MLGIASRARAGNLKHAPLPEGALAGEEGTGLVRKDKQRWNVWAGYRDSVPACSLLEWPAFSSACASEFPEHQLPSFHLNAQGPCWLGTEGGGQDSSPFLPALQYLVIPGWLRPGTEPKLAIQTFGLLVHIPA